MHDERTAPPRREPLTLDSYDVEDRGYTTPCWIWHGKPMKQGYGRLGRKRYAHRLMYEHHVGPIPDGLELDHLCRVRICVNPDHVEPVTHAENMRRSGPAQKTHCVNGHEYTPENTSTRATGTRNCRACMAERSLAYWVRKRAAAQAQEQEAA